MPAVDDFKGHQTGLDSPAYDGFAITPSDSTDFAKAARGVYVGVGGDVVLISMAGTVLTFKNANAGTVIPCRCTRVNNTNTTATNLIGLY